jgi:hypothetical protein
VPVAEHGSRVKEGSSSFLKKRTKKLLSVGGPWQIVSANEQKFFVSFFQKRNTSLPYRHPAT